MPPALRPPIRCFIPRRAGLRRGAVHVSRPGADSAQDLDFAGGVNVTLGPALHAHLARPRHGVRHRRHRPGRPDSLIAALSWPARCGAAAAGWAPA